MFLMVGDERARSLVKRGLRIAMKAFTSLNDYQSKLKDGKLFFWVSILFITYSYHLYIQTTHA
jgi:hypothetical protein